MNIIIVAEVENIAYDEAMFKDYDAIFRHDDAI